tara:strand:- start:177 stop:596 length:420 start_codon:yes stop_codon:yes gene_type:complete
MSNSRDDSDWDDYHGLLQEYLEERADEYLERLESDPFEDYYGATTKKSKDDAYTSLMKTYVKDLERITKDLKPCSYTVISGSGTAYFLEPLTRTFIKTERGSEVVVVPGDPDEDGKLLVRTMNTFLLVPHEEIIDLGYN